MPLMISGALGRAASQYLPGYRQRRREDEEQLIQEQNRDEERKQRDANRNFGRLLAQTASSPNRRQAMMELANRAASDPAFAGVSPEILSRLPEFVTKLEELEYNRNKAATEQTTNQTKYKNELLLNARLKGMEPVYAEGDGYPLVSDYRPLARENLPLETQANIDARNRQWVRPPSGVKVSEWDNLERKARQDAEKEWENYHSTEKETWVGNEASTERVAKPGHPDRKEFVEGYVNEQMSRRAQDYEAQNMSLPPSAQRYIEPPQKVGVPELLSRPPEPAGKYKVYRPGEPSTIDTLIGAPPVSAPSIAPPSSPFPPVTTSADTSQVVAQFEEVATDIATKTGKPKSQVMQDLYSRISPEDPSKNVIANSGLVKP